MSSLGPAGRSARRIRCVMLGVVRAEICMVSFHTVLTRVLVVTLDLALSTWPACSTCTIQLLEPCVRE